MTPKASSTRRYDASRRQADARERQRRVVDAATQLFLERGYGATSIAEIAAEADVAVQTVYATFESKAGILARAVEQAIVGDDEPVPVAEREEARAVLATRDPADRLRLVATMARRTNARSAPLMHLVDSVAGVEAAVEELRRTLLRQLRQDVSALARSLPKDRLRRPVAETADVILLLASPATFTRLVADLGWSPARYERWLADTLVDAVLSVGVDR